jgi:hypothetical protein
MTDPTRPDQRKTAYNVEEILALRGQGEATALLPDISSPVLLAGGWWAVHENDPAGVYRPVEDVAVAAHLDEMAARLADASAALAALDVPGGGFLPDRPEQL